jgi:triphosphoribosyl-dephospho-CoA synthase
MALAAQRDRIAEQYVTNFHLVFQARSKICELFESSKDWESAVIALHLWILASWPDTLIARKCGVEAATHISELAKAILESNPTPDPQKLAEFDRRLRADGHRRNPGTTADLIAATLFAAARDGLIKLPSRAEIEQLATRIIADAASSSCGA